MCKLVAPFLFVWLIGSATAQEPLWLRYPSISPDGQTIAFTYKGDLYTVSSVGGVAQPLTFHEAHDFMPVWSRDGKSLAFASDRHGNFDVFIVSAQGGEPTRLTFHSASEYPYAFTHDNRAVLFGGVRQDAAEHRQYPTGSQPEVYTVPVQGGRVSQWWTVPAEDLVVSKDGSKILYHDKKGGENAWRKHHTSSITRDLWLYDRAKDVHTMITSFRGEDRNPVFSADEQQVFYLSEEGGSFNVYQLSLATPQQRQPLTSFKMHPVRFLSASTTGVLCFSYDGQVYTMKAGGQPQKVNIALRTAGKTNNERVLAINGNVREMAIAPSGKEVAFITRGEVFVSSVEGGVTKRITHTPEQERFLSFSPSGDALLYASERNNQWQIFQTQKTRADEPYFYASTLLKETVVIQNKVDSYQPKFSPDGKEIAYIEDRRSLKVYTLATRQTRTLLTPNELFYMADGDQYFEWSPDGKWLAAEYAPVMANSEVILVPADGTGKFINLTESGYGDQRPVWANGGKQLLWFSDRDGLRSYANSGQRQADVYSVFLTRDAWDRYRLSKEDYALLKEMEEKSKPQEKKEGDKKDVKKNVVEVKKDSSVRIDWDGLRDRKARLTLHSSSLSDAVLSKDGEKLLYLARFEKGLNLWSTHLRTRETKMELALDANSASLQWDKEKKSLFLLADGRISKINPDSWKKESVSINGEMTLDVAAERKHMFDHVWRRTKAMFYISTYHGAPWDALYGEYAKHVPHAGNGHEFAELLSEMLGELNVSHSGARYGSSTAGDDNTASLGIFMDYTHTGDGVRIAEVIKGGPLDKASLPIKAGMIIEQIDGEVILPNRDVAAYLNRKADTFTHLLVVDPATNQRSQVTVKPMGPGEENALLYKRWVKKNADEVEKLSNGQLGYVHIPGMSDGPYRTVYEEMMGKYHDKKGVVVDTRFNGGGDLVSDLAMFFTGKKFLDYAIESRSVGYEPAFRWTKPTVAMFNESNYSDGHCFACGYTDLGIGKTIGMPVPGTCSFAGWELLSDGATRWGAVPVSAKNSKGQWLENVETAPDILVKNEPGIIARGRDQQLERAVEELLKGVR
ncbi:MAG: S41 family peptidase [Cyclobacteriaceae bacterium]|jgi:Tol biopolymer transport system component/C-terminal processing protease CtpA/Prc|nr:S41 family peptidase [Cyclobacteriaceae bacterium]